MKEKDIVTIELNLDDDFANACAYHVDYLSETIKRNIEHAELKQKTQRWVLVGLAYSLNEGLDKCEKLRQILCKRNDLKPYGIEELLYNMGEE